MLLAIRLELCEFREIFSQSCEKSIWLFSVLGTPAAVVSALCEVRPRLVISSGLIFPVTRYCFRFSLDFSSF